MSKEANISLHMAIIAKARQLAVGSDARINIIHRSIQGIIRALSADYNEIHA